MDPDGTGGRSLLSHRSPVLAIGWATVETERSMEEFAASLVRGAEFRRVADSQVLGARCVVATGDPRRMDLPPFIGAVGGTLLVVLLEPSTEGRLAATLARHGEGWCATWEPAVSGPHVASLPVSAERPGPFGTERLVLDAPVSGPHRLLASTATIGP